MDIFSNNQLGFTSRKSTTDALIIFSNLTNLDTNKKITGIILDINKTFYFVDHRILIFMVYEEKP